MGPSFYMGSGHVLEDGGDGGRVPFHEVGRGGSAREGLDAACPRTGEQVEHARAAQVRLEDREERLLDPIRQRPGCLARREEADSSGRAGDDAACLSHVAELRWRVPRPHGERARARW